MSWELLGILVGGYLVLSIYSFLWKENPVYRFAEHLFIGVGTGVGIVFLWKQLWQPKFVNVVMGWDLAPHEPYSYWRLLLLVAAAFGLGIYGMLTERYRWVAQCVIGFGLGYAGGVAFEGFFNEYVPLVVDSFRPMIVVSKHQGFLLVPTLENWLFLVSLVCVMTYFFYTFELNRVELRAASHTGRWMMMITFGAFFGSTVMGRMALLIDRLQFLKGDWWNAHVELFTGL